MSDVAPASRFLCRSCGAVHSAWSARCPRCSSWGLEWTSDAPDLEDQEAPAREFDRPRLVIARSPLPEPELDDPIEELVDFDPDGPLPITEIAEATHSRVSTSLPPVDHVLGGGLVAASVVLLASPRGIGKSSLTLQVLAGLDQRCLYVTGEETREQVAGTARRIGAVTPKLHVLAERNLAKIFANARRMRAQTIAIDSIQKMSCDEVGGRAGTPAQLKECTAQLVDFAKTTGTTLWLIGHVTGDGDIAGPKTIEHEVDVVLELTGAPEKRVVHSGEHSEVIAAVLESPRRRKLRVLRCLDKNRFGESDRSGYLELTPTGLVPIDLDGWDEPL